MNIDDFVTEYEQSEEDPEELDVSILQQPEEPLGEENE